MRAAFFHDIGSYILLPVAEANSDATLLYIDESTADLRHNNVKKLLEETYGSESVRRKFIPEFSRWREDIEKRLTNEDAHEKALRKWVLEDAQKYDGDDDGAENYADEQEEDASFFQSITWKYLRILLQFILVAGIGAAFLLW